MTGHDISDDMALDQVALRFAELWHALTHDGNTVRNGEESRLLIDRVRTALDRGHARLGASPSSEMVADTFLIEELMHEGPLVQIYRVRHRDLGTAYALKTLRPEHADDAICASLLLREARMHMSVRHENVVSAHVVLRLSDGRPALLLEWMEGGSLSQRLKETKRFPAGTVHAIMEGLISGMQAIHAAGFVHADITPANLLFAGDDPASLKIADFSIAREYGSDDHNVQRMVQTRSRLAPPECTVGGLPDERSDLHACGQILLHLLQRSIGNAALATDLAALARQLTYDDPDRRPQSAEEAFTILRTIAP
ncbi:serine/threonine protein kinase [Phyllobacterium phragmitis]|uniref:Serine/threonine protein kinase n=1 Tax=Phyllobacterium phragmitis TaxID=2670329 RepID=A0A2S9IKW8_9HYPH|nr:protein kinase [Phyllobacterium phragmitis]PRD41142.1 serine/threonine protein kinase [Phyllobacterium phragmitis]